MQIHIPEPCHQDWNEMIYNDEGRHCNSCAKTVIDFTGMTPEVISAYLELHESESVCGRFRGTQVVQQKIDEVEFVHHLSKSPLSFFKKIAAVIVFAVFIATAPTFSQTQRPKNAQILGKPAPVPHQISRGNITHPLPDSITNLSSTIDSIMQSPKVSKPEQPDYQIMGMISRPTPQLRKPKSKR